MQFDVTDTDSALIILVGESRIDAAIATSFKDKLREVILRHRKPVEMRMSSVDFMDSSGLGAMIALRKAMPQDLGMSLIGMTPNVERVFRLTRMDSVFDIRAAATDEEQKE
ncbi:STAS domain-containing protein [Paracoccus sp. Z330]|uniref:Anti-sigma factor antagonist n=1 Tax=Paracoccus onchidii TaxID=3017813 RepID=A0ABT4ZJ98_9RHOB|nr:STAS domain-containing protein [Paracoccus onchidii]MDB6179367.1 STAS domain-containing protein [Paracoccus onchidii]